MVHAYPSLIVRLVVFDTRVRLNSSYLSLSYISCLSFGRPGNIIFTSQEKKREEEKKGEILLFCLILCSCILFASWCINCLLVLSWLMLLCCSSTLFFRTTMMIRIIRSRIGSGGTDDYGCK